MSTTPTTDLAQVADAIRGHDRFLLVTHENPDGDALGSILAMKLGLDRLGKDSGRCQYTNTTPTALRLAAALVEASVDVQRVFRGIYESVEFAKLKLLARALERAQVYDGGRLVISYLLRSDFNELGVGEEFAEGIIDYLRSVDGAEMAATIREPPEPPDAARRISLRASSDETDVSAIARQRGGGGHRQAAGFSSPESIEEIVEFIRSAFAASHAAQSA